MPFNIAKTVLRKLRMMYLEHPQQLTDTERAIAERIVICSLCDFIWLKRSKKQPARCCSCHKTQWDRPLLNAMILAGPKHDVDASTIVTRHMISTDAEKGGPIE